MLHDRTAELIRGARKDVGMTQIELASAAGIHQPTLAAYEAGRRHPSEATLKRVLAAARMRPSLPLTLFADGIIESATAHRLGNVRVFGSVLTGDDTQDSDIDLLVTPTTATSLFDLGGFVADVEAITGFPVDVITDGQTRNPRFAHVVDEAVSL